MVDHLDQQLLLVQLQERHTWNHDRVFAHQAPGSRVRGVGLVSGDDLMSHWMPVSAPW